MNSTQQIAIAAGALLALGFLFRRPIATVTTSETFDLSPYGGPTNYTPKVQQVAAAIAKQEGFYVAGSVPQRANNPGDLKVPGLPTLPGTSITYFSSPDLGWAALHRQLQLIIAGESQWYHLDMTIAEMAATWTATQQRAWSENVSMFLGVSPSARLWEVLT